MMKDIKDRFAKLGFNLEINPDIELSRFKKGKHLKVSNFVDFKIGDVIYVQYKEYSEYDYYRVDGAYRITKKESNYICMSDGSSFVCDFTLDPNLQENDFLFDEKSGAGEMYLFGAGL